MRGRYPGHGSTHTSVTPRVVSEGTEGPGPAAAAGWAGEATADPLRGTGPGAALSTRLRMDTTKGHVGLSKIAT